MVGPVPHQGVGYRVQHPAAGYGALRTGIAHEVNNPLGVVLMYAHLLLEEWGAKPEIGGDLKMIAEQADRCKKIVKGLLDFARQTKPERTESNINLVLNEVIALLEHQAIFHNIDIVKDHSPGLPLVDVDVDASYYNIVVDSSSFYYFAVCCRRCCRHR